MPLYRLQIKRLATSSLFKSIFYFYSVYLEIYGMSVILYPLGNL